MGCCKKRFGRRHHVLTELSQSSEGCLLAAARVSGGNVADSVPMMGGARPFICALSPVPSMRHRKQHSNHVQDASAYRRCNELSNTITQQWRLSDSDNLNAKLCALQGMRGLGRPVESVRHGLELPSVAGIDELRPGLTSDTSNNFFIIIRQSV